MSKQRGTGEEIYLSEDGGVLVPQQQPFHISQTVVARVYNVYLSQEIVEPERYTKLFDLLRNAGQYDTFNIHINSPGGDLFTGNQLINAMKASAAKVVTILDGTAFSLAPLILFAGDEIHVTEHSMIMFHDFSTGQVGKGSELLSSSIAMAGYYKQMLEKYASLFLSEQEIDDIINGKDLYFGTEEIIKRIKAINEANEEEPDEELEFVDLDKMKKSEIVDFAVEYVELTKAEASKMKKEELIDYISEKQGFVTEEDG